MKKFRVLSFIFALVGLISASIASASNIDTFTQSINVTTSSANTASIPPMSQCHINPPASGFTGTFEVTFKPSGSNTGMHEWPVNDNDNAILDIPANAVSSYVFYPGAGGTVLFSGGASGSGTSAVLLTCSTAAIRGPLPANIGNAAVPGILPWMMTPVDPHGTPFTPASPLPVSSPAPAVSAALPSSVPSGLTACCVTGNASNVITPAAPVLCTSDAPVVSLTTTTILITAIASKSIYICGYSLVSGGTTYPNIQFYYGTGVGCTTGKVTLSGIYNGTVVNNINAQSVFPMFQTTASQSLCVGITGGSSPTVNGWVNYTQF